MGLIDKFKNMFTEEVEEEEVAQVEQTIKTNIVEREEPKKRYNEVEQQPVKPTLSRSTPLLDDTDIIKKYVAEEQVVQQPEKITPPMEEKTLKREEKFVFPVYFDDKDFEKIEEKPKKVETKKVPEKKEIYGTKIEKKEEPKTFKPTPIISPIYGVLDKNYHKEDITSKKVSHSDYRDPAKPLSIDEVRKKAYGTLEDDIETSLFTKSSIFMEPESEKDSKEESKNNLLTDLVEENEYSSVDDFLNSSIEDYKARHKQDIDDFDLNDELDNLEISENQKLDTQDIKSEVDSSSLDDILINSSYDSDDKLLEDYIMNNSIENAETKDDEEDLTQSDLFNLIDSMYEKGEDE